MPKTISIGTEADRNNTISSIERIRNLAGIEKKNVVIDFSDTRYTIADGMLILYAELLRLKKFVGSKVDIRCRLPVGATRIKSRPVIEDAEKVAQVLKHIGILDLLGNSAKITPARKDVIHWKIAHGSKSEGKKTEPILEVVDELLGTSVSKKFYTGITEAMTNSHHHAYEELREDGLSIEGDSGWWLFSQIQDGTLSILICDLGIGIPRSLPRTHSSFIVEVMNRRRYIHRDSAAIEYATQTGSTSTDLPNRGKGLKKMVKLVKDIPNSTLAIYSNAGAFYCNDKDTMEGFIKKDFTRSILDTLIYWTVDISKGDTP